MGNRPFEWAKVDGRQNPLRVVARRPVSPGAAILTGSSSLFEWACTYRIANFPLGGPDIRSRSRTPRPSPTSLRPTWVGGSFFVRQDRRSPPSSTLPLRPNTRPHYLRCAPIGASGIRRRDDGLGRYRRLPMPRRQNQHPLASRRPVLRARSMASCSVPNGPCHRLSGRREPFTPLPSLQRLHVALWTRALLVGPSSYT